MFDNITDRITDIDKKTCPICQMPPEGVSITPCCNNVFCLECITMAIKTSKKHECPLCRATLNINSLRVISDTKKSDTKAKENELPTKMEKLIELLKSNKRFMVFSEYDGGISNIEKKLKENGIAFSGIKGTSNTITNTIDKFKNKEFNVLLLNAKYFGAGLNLQFTDEVIIFHRMSKDLEKQVIGRAQRMGRENPLVINYLCYDNEY